MKKRGLLMFGMAVMLASCSQDSFEGMRTDGVATITATVEETIGTRVPTYSSDDVTIDRCLLEVYDSEGNIVGQQHTAQAGGSDGKFTFTVSGLDPDALYDFVFWADNSGAAAYSGSLTDRRLSEGADLTEALAYRGSISSTKPADAVSVTLTHAVAKVTLKSTGTLSAGDKVSLGMTGIADTWNVLSGDAAGTAAKTYEYTLTSAVTGTAEGAELTTFYVPAPALGANSNMTLTYTPAGGSTAGTAEISNVPLRANYRTVLSGDVAALYSGETVNISAALSMSWEEPDTEVDFPVTNEIETTAAGQLTKEAVIKAAEAGNGSVVIKGPVSNADLMAIAECEDLRINLDLSGATLYADDGTTPLTEFPFTLCERYGNTSKAMLTGIVLPDGIESLAVDCFHGCNSLATVTLPESLKIIGSSAFQGTAITVIDFPESLEQINGYAFGDTRLKGELIVPEGVSVPETSTFSNTDITNVVWNSASSLGNNTFSGCKSLQTVTINNCGGINNNAFGLGCTVSTLVINMTVPPAIIGGSEFKSADIEHIYVPSDAVDTYKSATGWSNYAAIIEPIQ